ncbi:MAG: cobalamin-binding protein [Bacteroidota bacterium]
MHGRVPLLLLLCALPASLPAQEHPAVRDDRDRLVVLPGGPARRIVSLAPSITETLFAIGAGPQVAGVTDYCNEPVEALSRPRVGGLINPNLETVVGLRPDLILLSMEGNLREDFDALERTGIPVFVTNPRSLAGIQKSIRDLGRLTGRDSAAGALSSRIEARRRAVEASLRMRARPSAVLIVSARPLMVAGSGTFLAELLDLAGSRNIAAASGLSYPVFSREALLAANPEVVLFLSDAAPSARDLASLYPEWSSLGAFRAGRVLRVEADIVSRPGPRAGEALNILFNAIHGRKP